jgi:DNA-directed RNA polymerase alpha subunit
MTMVSRTQYWLERTHPQFVGLSSRAFNCLRNANSTGIETVEELTQMTEAQLLDQPNLGPRTVCEIKDWLAAKGLSLRQD